MGYNSAFKGLTTDKNNTRTLHEDRYTFLIISRSVLLRMRNVSDKSCTENQNTHFVFSNFFSENRTVYEIMWKNNVERVRPHKAIWCMRISCWIPNATDTHSEYVTLDDFLLQQWLYERASMSRYTYIGCFYAISLRTIKRESFILPRT